MTVRPRVVCLHGLGRTPADWNGVRAALAPFGDVTAPHVPSAPQKALEVLDDVMSPGSIVIDDHHVPVDFAIAARARQPAWSLRILDHGGHHAHLTEPALWGDTATSWLDSLK
jgi:hypothetical protein